jgi:hypothetical protein
MRKRRAPLNFILVGDFYPFFYGRGFPFTLRYLKLG